MGRANSRPSSKTRSGHDDRAGCVNGDGEKSPGDELRHDGNQDTKRHRRPHHGDDRSHHHHHHRHHSRERGDRRKERSKDEQLDDLTMTLHAEDELYQLHKRAPAVDSGTESEQEYNL